MKGQAVVPAVLSTPAGFVRLETVKFQADVKIHSWRPARRGFNHREDGSKVVLDTFACAPRRPQATVVVTVGVITGARPVQGVGVGQSLGTVEAEVKQVTPR